MSHAALAATLLIASALDSAGLSSRYARVVGLYASGDRAAAVSQIGDFSDDDLRRELKALRKALGPGAPSCELCEREISLRAALMLHTDRALFERARLQRAAPEPECVASFEADAAAAIAEIVACHDGGLRDFAGRWAAATAMRARADGCMLDAVHFVDLGLKWDPRNAMLLLVRGMVHETIASALASSPQARPEAGRVGSMRCQDELELARASFESALAADPGLAEARLRLGRTEWRMGDVARARSSLQAVLAAEPKRSIAYLAHLFLGRLDEDASRFVEARREYSAALDIDPGAQVAGLAVSHALLMDGDEGAAREALKAALGSKPRSADDIYWGYPMGGAALAQTLFEKLRGEASQ